MLDIVVSIICNTYNHKKYIRNALESFVMQKTDFSYEVLVHDDASTDGTADIIREYEKKYPDVIKPVYQAENQYSKKIPITFMYQYPRVKGKYVALCEGDDYWTDPYKLQKQVTALEAHPEVDICAHAAAKVLADTGEVVEVIAPPYANMDVIPVEQVIQGGGGFVATNSLMFRAELCKNVPLFVRMLYIDYAVQVHGALRGGMLYLKDNMACYCWQSEGSWTFRMAENPARYEAWTESVLKMLRQMDEDTNHRYHEAIIERYRYNEFRLLQMQGNYAAMRKEPYRQLYRQLSLKRKLGLAVGEFAPWLYKLLNR